MISDLIYKQLGRDYYYKTWHKLESNMFMYVHSGSGSIVSRDRAYPLKDGILCFIGVDKYHYTFPEIIETYERTKLFISSDELMKLTRLLPSSEYSQLFCDSSIIIGVLDEEARGEAEEIFSTLERYADSEYFPAERCSAALRLMTLILKNLAHKTPKRSGAMQRAVEYINDHITEEISIESICAVNYMSKYHFCRQFKRQMGLTVMEYILKTRIIMAKELLSEADLSIGEVSESCGFSSPSYFSRVFKADTGMTPTQYKKARWGGCDKAGRTV